MFYFSMETIKLHWLLCACKKARSCTRAFVHVKSICTLIQVMHCTGGAASVSLNHVKSSCNVWSLVSYSRVWIHSRLWPWTTSPLWQRPALPLSSCKRYSPIWSHRPTLPPCQSPPPHTPHGRAKLQEEQDIQWQKRRHICLLIPTFFFFELTGISTSKSSLFIFIFFFFFCMHSHFLGIMHAGF